MTVPPTLLDAWALGDVVDVTEVAEGATNRVFRVHCAERDVFLKIYRRPDRAIALREHALIRHVHHRGLPAPLPIVADRGDTLVEHDGQLAALYEAARGSQMSPGRISIDQARSAGEVLARVHAATAELPDVGYGARAFAWSGAEWVERLNVVARAIRERNDYGPLDEWALQRVDAQRSWLEDARCVHGVRPRFRPQLIHGDYHDANLFFDDENVSAIIDWEQAVFLPRAYEVVRACHFMFRCAPQPTQVFLSAYRATAELGDVALGEDELADGAATWGCYADHHVWPVEEVYLHGNERARRFIPDQPFRPFAEAWAEAIGSERPAIA